MRSACRSCGRRSRTGWAGASASSSIPSARSSRRSASKEAIFSFAQVALDPGSGRDTVVVTEPGYPVAERGTRFAGGEVVHLPLLEETGFLPDLDGVDPAIWRRAAVVWTNYPNNPTGVTAPRSFYERLASLAAEHDFLVASDEAYSELWFEARPPSRRSRSMTARASSSSTA